MTGDRGMIKSCEEEGHSGADDLLTLNRRFEIVNKECAAMETVSSHWYSKRYELYPCIEPEVALRHFSFLPTRQFRKRRR